MERHPSHMGYPSSLFPDPFPPPQVPKTPGKHVPKPAHSLRGALWGRGGRLRNGPGWLRGRGCWKSDAHRPFFPHPLLSPNCPPPKKT